MSRNTCNKRWIGALVARLARRLGGAARGVVAPLRLRRGAVLRPAYVHATRNPGRRITAEYCR
jgi:hypothetical protein